MRTPLGYLTFERCKYIASKYNYKKEFRVKEPIIYNAILRNKWSDILTSHMNGNIKWSYEKCKEEVAKYNYKKDLRLNNSRCYQVIYRNKWFELLENLKSSESLKKRYIYVYEFPIHNSVYIGLTWNIEIRNYKHLNEKESSVFQFINKNNLNSKDYILKIIGYYECGISSKVECEFIDKYKENGWNILNKVRGGCLGSNRLYWTKERCIETSKQFNTIKQFNLAYKGAYKRCCDEGWLDDIRIHMKGNIKWSYEKCKEEAAKYNTRGAFKKGCPNGYTKSRQKKWLDIFYVK